MKIFVVSFVCYILVTMASFGQASGGGVVYQGLTNSPLGNASLNIACCVSNLGSGGQDGLALIVTNIGSSGQDGVSIALPANLTTADVAIMPLDPSNALPVGAYIQIQALGAAGGLPSSVLGTLTETKAGTSNYVVSADYSPIGASTFTVQAYLSGILVAQATNQSGAALAVLQAPAFTMWWGHADTDVPWPPSAVLIGNAPGTNVSCDHIYFIPENVSLPNPTAVNITASQVPALTITRENESLIYQGLTNTSLGSASVSIACCVSNLGSAGQDGVALTALYVTNLGSGGQDGVSITLPATTGGGLNVGYPVSLLVIYEPLDPSNALPVGAYVQDQAVGTANGITNGVLGTVTLTKAGTSNYTISADYSALGASTYTARAFLHGTLVAQARGLGGSSLAQVNIPPNGADVGDKVTPLSKEWLGGNATLTIGTTKSVQCDRLVIAPENVASVIGPSAFQIVASQVPSLTITSENEGLVYQGLTNTSLGSASMAIDCCISNLSSGGQDGLALIVTNLGSSGQDGVSIALPASLTSLAVQWQDLDDADTLPVGAFVQQQLVGTANGVANSALGTMTVTKAGTSNYTVSADFSPVGVGNYAVQAYLSGALAGQTTNQPGTSLASCAIWPPKIDWETNDEGSATVSVHWLSALTVALGGGGSVTCDTLLITPEGLQLSGAPTVMNITASGVPAMTFTTEAVSPLVLNLSITSQSATLQWFGTAALQESTDLLTWTTVSNSFSPYSATAKPSPSGPSKFYRLVFRP